jgi:Flp pilus assembly protein TadG
MSRSAAHQDQGFLRRPRRGSRVRRRGASAVEFAMVSPFLFALLLGMMEFGRVLVAHQVVTSAARTGAREAILPGATTTTVNNAVAAVAGSSLFPLNSITAVCSTNPASASAGTTITVTVSVPMSGISALGQSWFGPEYRVTSVASMRKEGFE